MTDTEIKRWRFMVEDWDDHAVYVDGEGGPDGDEQEAEFVGTSHQAMREGDRRCDLWEARNGRMAARVTRESYGPPNKRYASEAPHNTEKGGKRDKGNEKETRT